MDANEWRIDHEEIDEPSMFWTDERVEAYANERLEDMEEENERWSSELDLQIKVVIFERKQNKKKAARIKELEEGIKHVQKMCNKYGLIATSVYIDELLNKKP